MVTDLLPIEFWLVIFCVSLAATAALGGWRRAGLPAMVGILGGANALGAFFADLWIPSEMARHAFIGSIVLRIGVVLALAVFLDVVGHRIEGRSACSRHGVNRQVVTGTSAPEASGLDAGGQEGESAECHVAIRRDLRGSSQCGRYRGT